LDLVPWHLSGFEGLKLDRTTTKERVVSGGTAGINTDVIMGFRGGPLPRPRSPHPPHRADSKSIAGVMLRFDAVAVGGFWVTTWAAPMLFGGGMYASPRDALQPAWSALASPR